jgi:YidC/Oxa1 family membrane protein insertase
MDRTSVIVVTICVILLFTWPALLEKISPTPPQPIQPTNAAPARVAGQTNAPNTAPFRQAPPSQGPVSPDFKAPVKLDSPEISILESEESYYIFTSEGGLKTVELKKPHVVLGDNVDLLWDTNNGDVDSKPIILNHGVELPVFALKGIDDSEFSITADDNRVTMVSTNKAGIRITKEFSAGTNSNYLLHSTITLANPMSEPVEVQPAIDAGAFGRGRLYVVPAQAFDAAIAVELKAMNKRRCRRFAHLRRCSMAT